MISIVDCGIGNLGSIVNMLKRLGVQAETVRDADALARARKIILPGVGAFDAAMERVNASGLREVLDRKAMVERVPVLGICLGMELLSRGSEEGKLPGLNWIPAETKLFPEIPGLKIPHMGWNVVHMATPSPLTAGFEGETRFYFAHSYYVRADDRRDAILTSTYGIEFDSAIAHENIFGTQFHPEKSHRFGMQVLRNFSAL